MFPSARLHVTKRDPLIQESIFSFFWRDQVILVPMQRKCNGNFFELKSSKWMNERGSSKKEVKNVGRNKDMDLDLYVHKTLYYYYDIINIYIYIIHIHEWLISNCFRPGILVLCQNLIHVFLIRNVCVLLKKLELSTFLQTLTTKEVTIMFSDIKDSGFPLNESEFIDRSLLNLRVFITIPHRIHGTGILTY